MKSYLKITQKEKDVHISGLLADLMNQTPVTAENFQQLKGKILLILPDQDFFFRQNAGEPDSSHA